MTLVVRRDGADRLRFTEGDRSLGVAYFILNAADWFWVEGAGDEDDKATPIWVDRDQTQRFITELQSIARQSEVTRPVLQAEWEGRVRIFRDETADMALMYGKLHARRASMVPEGCTGWADTDGSISHDGDTCPIHEDAWRCPQGHSNPEDATICVECGWDSSYP